MNEDRKRLYEVIFGITLAIFAAILAVADLGGGKYGGDEVLASNQKASAFMWYQSKSIKQSLSEGEQSTVNTLIQSGAIAPTARPAMEKRLADIDAEIKRYKLEKNEILLGSDKVGKEKWAQEVDGELGKVIGAKQYEDLANQLGSLGDVFDLATLFLQMCLVMGAIGIVVETPLVKIIFFCGMLSMGVVGSVYTWNAYGVAATLPKIM